MKPNISFFLIYTIALVSLAAIMVAVPMQLNSQVLAQNQSEGKGHFYANLTSDGVIPPLQSDTGATGNASFTLVGDGNTMSYKLSGSEIGNVSDLSLGSSTGGRFSDLVIFTSAPVQGLLTQGSGTLEGNFTSADFRGQLSGKQMSDLVKMILDGNIYVRVQTTDFPLGEIGGKVQPVLQ